MVSTEWKGEILKSGYRSQLPGIGEDGVAVIELITGIEGGDFESDLQTAKALVAMMREFNEELEEVYRSTLPTSRTEIVRIRKEVMHNLAESIATRRGIANQENFKARFTKLANTLGRFQENIR